MRLVLLGSRDTIIGEKTMVEGILKKYRGMKKWNMVLSKLLIDIFIFYDKNIENEMME